MNFVLTEDHRYMLDGKEVPGLTRTLKDAGLVDDTWFTKYGKERGSAVHRAAMFVLEGDLDENSVDPAIRGYVDAAKAAIAGLQIEPVIIEEPLYCARYRFGCTPDVCGPRPIGWPTSQAIVEWKTGQVDEVVGVQLAGQQMALEERIGLAQFDRIAVKLNIDGSWQAKVFTEASDRDVFLSALALANWKRNKKLI